MALTSDDPTGQAVRSPGGHAVCEFVGAGCPGTALGLDAVESALGSFFAGLKVALQGAAVFVAGEFIRSASVAPSSPAWVRREWRRSYRSQPPVAAPR